MFITDPMKKFLSDPKILDLIDANKFEQLYVEAKAGGHLMCSELTNILLASDIYPLPYMECVPCGYLYLSKDNAVVTIPNNIIAIKEHAFTKAQFQSIELSSSLDSIHPNAFNHCNLTHVEFPDSVRYIGWGAFHRCEKLQSIVFSENSQLEQLADDCFSGCCNLGDIVLPKSLQHVGEHAFARVGGNKTVTILSPDCYLHENFIPPYHNLVLRCYRGSTTEQWAKENGVNNLVYLD